MRILVISNIEWSNENAFGNTVSNWFEGMSDVEFASIYTRGTKPRNKVCDSYYSITSTSIMKNFFSKEKIGRAFFMTEEMRSLASNTSDASFEKKLISVIHKKNLKIFYKAEETLFATKRWINNKFKKFVCDFKPDIVFSFISGSAQLSLILSAVRALAPNSKYVGFICDDVYGASDSEKKRARVEKLIKSADKVYGISELLCNEYSKKFGVSIDTLYKGCNFSDRACNSNDVIQIVYAGNLYYGRMDTLLKVIDSIESFNMSAARKAKLNIYSGTLLNDDEISKLNRKGASEFCGSRPYDMIKLILNSADAALHIESFDKSQQELVKLSFSTKITDCLQSGAVLMVIGPSGIASVEYAKKIPGAVVIDREDDIKDMLKNIIVGNLTEMSEKTRAFAKEYHSIDKIQNKIKTDFLDVINK